MKQLLISEIFPPRTGGSGRWFWEIYRRLNQEEYYVAPGQTDLPKEEIDNNSMIVARLPLSLKEWGIRSLCGLMGYWRAARETIALVKRHRIDRIHCARMLPEGWIALLLKKWQGTPFVCYVHGEETSYGVHSRELGWMMRRVLANADYLIANSINTAKILKHDWQVSASRIRILRPGADTEKFIPQPENDEIRRKLGWENRLVLLTVGRLQERKGHDVLIQALPLLRSAFPNILYAIVGEGEQRSKLEYLIKDLQLEDHVHLLGELDDILLVECYQQCDLFILPNREVDGDIEGFGMVLVEAQACGKPVIAGDSGGTSETMAVGESGIIVDCTQPNSIAKEVTQLLNDSQRRAQMGERGRAWVLKHFSWSALSDTAAKVLSE